jgi:hypothetical protein
MKKTNTKNTQTIEKDPIMSQVRGAIRRVGSERSGHWEIVE